MEQVRDDPVADTRDLALVLTVKEKAAVHGPGWCPLHKRRGGADGHQVGDEGPEGVEESDQGIIPCILQVNLE